jgi:L-ornithine Nalpha-acyltransferase
LSLPSPGAPPVAGIAPHPASQVPCPSPAPPPRWFRSARYEVRLATTDAETRAAQRLCYKGFFLDRDLTAPVRFAAAERVFDDLDPYADHLIVIDRMAGQGALGPRVVGTYRAIRYRPGVGRNQFCAASAFDLGPILERSPAGLCEISRACVDMRYRQRRVVEMLWAGLSAYAAHYQICAYFGAASLPGADSGRHELVLNWLLTAGQPPSPGTAPPPVFPQKARALRRALPPLLRAYIDAGACVSGPPRPDPAFDTTDVLAWMNLKNLPRRHLRHFAAHGAKLPASPPCEDPPR